jgi:hypothetical protein
MRRQVPRLFRSALETVVNSETHLIKESLQDRLMKLIEEAQNLAIASYHERQTVMIAGWPRSMLASQTNIELPPNDTIASESSSSSIAEAFNLSPRISAHIEASFDIQAVQASQKPLGSSDSGYLSCEPGDMESTKVAVLQACSPGPFTLPSCCLATSAQSQPTMLYHQQISIAPTPLREET